VKLRLNLRKIGCRIWLTVIPIFDKKRRESLPEVRKIPAKCQKAPIDEA
jgi:hypothetical protein